MKRTALALLFLVSPLAFGASKPLTPGVYTVAPCLPAAVCPPLVTCPAVEPCPTCPPSRVTATNAAPPVCLQPVQPESVGADLRLGAADPLAATAHPQKAWFKDWRFWAASGGALILGAVIEHNYGDDYGSSGASHHAHDAPEPDPPIPCHGPPGWCRNH